MFKKDSILRTILDGTILDNFIVKHHKYIFFLCFLAVVSIYSNFAAEKKYLDKIKLQDSFLELKAESTLISSELMNLSKEFEVSKLADKNNLELLFPEKPVYKIYSDTAKIAKE